MDEETFRATFVLMDTYTNFGTSKEDVQKETKSKIREAYGFIDNEIIRILPYEEAVQKPLSLEDDIGDFLMDAVVENIHLFIMQKNPNTTRPKTRREAVD